jgi:hypothetical protein
MSDPLPDPAQLRKLLALLWAMGGNVEALSQWPEEVIGIPPDKARATLSRPEFPWAEVQSDLIQRQADAILANELGRSEEYVREYRARLRDPHGKPFSPSV